MNTEIQDILNCLLLFEILVLSSPALASYSQLSASFIRCIFLSDPSIFHLFFWQEVDGLAPMMTSWKHWRFLKESSAKQTVRNIRLVFFPRHRALRSLPAISTFSVLKAKSETSNCVKLYIDRSIYLRFLSCTNTVFLSIILSSSLPLFHCLSTYCTLLHFL